ncbi:MAG: SHOCT domain-containing protein [Jatrophihabitantaceae bacterium]
MMWNHGGTGFGGWFAMGVTMLLLLSLVFVVCVAVAGRWSRTEPGRDLDPLARADARLAERFANGDIDVAEFELRRSLMHRERR